jgi:hypothetical protein
MLFFISARTQTAINGISNHDDMVFSHSQSSQWSIQSDGGRG